MYRAGGWWLGRNKMGLTVCLIVGTGVWNTVVGSMVGLCWPGVQDQTKLSACNMSSDAGFMLLNHLPSAEWAECTMWPTPAVSDPNLYTEKRRWRPDRGYAHCIVTLQDKDGALWLVQEEWITRRIRVEDSPFNIIAGVWWIFQSAQLPAEENLVFICHIFLAKLETQKRMRVCGNELNYYSHH